MPCDRLQIVFLLNSLLYVLLFSTLVSSNHHQPQQLLYQAPNLAYQHYKPRIEKIPSTVPPTTMGRPASTTPVVTTTKEPVPILEPSTVEPSLPESYQGYLAYAGRHEEPKTNSPPLAPPLAADEVSSEKEIVVAQNGHKKHPVPSPKTESKTGSVVEPGEDNFETIEGVDEGSEASIETEKLDSSPPGAPGSNEGDDQIDSGPKQVAPEIPPGYANPPVVNLEKLEKPRKPEGVVSSEKTYQGKKPIKKIDVDFGYGFPPSPRSRKSTTSTQPATTTVATSTVTTPCSSSPSSGTTPCSGSSSSAPATTPIPQETTTAPVTTIKPPQTTPCSIFTTSFTTPCKFATTTSAPATPSTVTSPESITTPCSSSTTSSGTTACTGSPTTTPPPTQPAKSASTTPCSGSTSTGGVDSKVPCKESATSDPTIPTTVPASTPCSSSSTTPGDISSTTPCSGGLPTTTLKAQEITTPCSSSSTSTIPTGVPCTGSSTPPTTTTAPPASTPCPSQTTTTTGPIGTPCPFAAAAAARKKRPPPPHLELSDDSIPSKKQPPKMPATTDMSENDDDTPTKPIDPVAKRNKALEKIFGGSANAEKDGKRFKQPMMTTTTTEKTVDRCKDRFDQCADWAADGECLSNPFWMKPNCQKSCGSCGLSLVEIDKPTPMRNCENKHELCQFWKSGGECELNKAYMKKNCPLSCGFCF